MDADYAIEHAALRAENEMLARQVAELRAERDRLEAADRKQTSTLIKVRAALARCSQNVKDHLTLEDFPDRGDVGTRRAWFQAEAEAAGWKERYEDYAARLERLIAERDRWKKDHGEMVGQFLDMQEERDEARAWARKYKNTAEISEHLLELSQRAVGVLADERDALIAERDYWKSIVRDYERQAEEHDCYDTITRSLAGPRQEQAAPPPAPPPAPPDISLPRSPRAGRLLGQVTQSED